MVAGEIVAFIPGQQIVDKSKTLLQTFAGAIAHGNRNRAVQFDDRRWLNAKQLVVEQRNPLPVRGGRGGTRGMNGRNGRLQSVGSEAARSKRAFGERDAFGDLIAVP